VSWRRGSRGATLGGLVAVLLLALRAGASDPRPSANHRGADQPVPAARPVDPDAWQRALPGRTVALPADHAAHPAYRIEWWYYTGNLRAPDGRAFGYQVTFFRVGVVRDPVNPSAFAVRDLYMTHVALTDVSAGRHRFADRLNRAGVQWAGAAADRYEVWNDSWRAWEDAQSQHRVVADAGEFALDLTLAPGKTPVLQGDRGYSRKGRDPGNASYYYSLTRMPTTGTVSVDGRQWTVEGASWMDHEFGTSALDPDTRGWDWFALQLSDGRELMVYRLRRDDGTSGPFSSGTLVERDGRTRQLSVSDFTLVPGRQWRSPKSGASYPVVWQVRVPSAGLDLAVEAALDAQELRTRRSTNVTYWEGSVRVSGSATGVGYLEMTGYSGAKLSDVMR